MPTCQRKTRPANMQPFNVSVSRGPFQHSDVKVINRFLVAFDYLRLNNRLAMFSRVPQQVEWRFIFSQGHVVNRFARKELYLFTDLRSITFKTQKFIYMSTYMGVLCNINKFNIVFVEIQYIYCQLWFC